MQNVPLHPMVVHFPIVLAVLLPIFAFGSLWAIRRGAKPLRAWGLTLTLTGALLISGFIATRTGEAEEERVEGVVAESVIHEHEEAAERFLVLTGIVLLVGLVGLAPAVVGSAARIVATAGSLAVILTGFQVGKAGGELVYKHNAASVYAAEGQAAQPAAIESANRERHDDDDD